MDKGHKTERALLLADRTAAVMVQPSTGACVSENLAYRCVQGLQLKVRQKRLQP